MSLDLLMNQALFIATAPLVADEYQNQVRDWAHPALAGVFGLVQPTESTEVTVDRNTVVSNWLLFLPVSASIDARARVTDGTTTWEVAGQPAVIRTPRGPHHIECRLVSIEG